MALLLHVTCIADAAMLMASRFPLVAAGADESIVLTHLFSDAAAAEEHSNT